MSKNAIITIVLVGLAIGGYMLTRNQNNSALLSVTQVSNSSSESGFQILQALNQLQSLRLDDSIFKDPVFIALTKESKPIQGMPTGKNNPFAPISNVGAASQTVAPETSSTSTKPVTQPKTTKATH